MKHLISSAILLLALLLPATAAAYDFEVDGIYYNVTGTNTVEVTYKVIFKADYTGDVAIPAAVTYNDTTYSVTAIGERAFEQCSSMKSVTIPKTVKFIGECAFGDCDSLDGIIVENGNPVYDSRDNCNAIIKTSSNTLIVGCKSTVIPNTVTALGSSAFSGCKGLTTITIPNSVTSIGSSAFFDCKGLKDVYSYIANPSAVSMDSNVFYKNPRGSDYSGRTLHVPRGKVGLYQADDRWYPFFGQIVEIEPEPVLLGDVNGDGEVNITDVNVVTDIIMGATLDAETMERADVNKDGSINISDVNVIIDIILNPAESKSMSGLTWDCPAAHCGRPAMWVPPAPSSTVTTSPGVRPSPRRFITGKPTSGATAVKKR